jgi:hypothetical protein
MAKTFGQYQGGIEASTGNLVPAYGQMADQTFRTMAGLAGVITKTYDTLNQQEEENSANKELIKGQSGNLAAIKKLMDANPDTKDSPLSQGISEMIAKLDSAGNLNRGQLKGLLKSSEVFTSQLPLTMQLQDKAFLAQTTAGVQKALAALKGQTVKDTKGYDIPIPSFQGGSPEKYQKDLTTFFEQHKKDNPEVQLDVGKAVRDSVQLQIQRFTNDPDLTKADPTYKQHLIRGFEALAKRGTLTDKLETQSSEEYGTGENIMGQVGDIAKQDALATASPADIRRGEIAAEALEAQRKAGGLPADGTAPVASKTPAITPEQEYERTKKYTIDETKKSETALSDLEKEDAALGKRIADMKLKEGKDMTNEEFKKAVERRDEIRKGLIPAAKETVRSNKYLEKMHLDRKDIIIENAKKYERERPKTRAEEEILAATQLTAEGKYKALVGVKADRSEKRYLEELLKDVNKGGYVGFGDRLAQMAAGNDRLYNEVTGDPEVQRAGYGVNTSPIPTASYFEGGVSRTANLEGMDIAGKRQGELADWVRDLRTTQDLGVFESGKDMKPAQKLAIKDMLAKRIADIDKRLANPVAVKEVTPAEARAKANSIIAGTGDEAAKPEAPKPDIYAMGFDYKMTIPGVFVNERPLTYDEEKAGVRKWFEENHNGVVPSTIDSIYKTIRPEAALIFAKGPNGENLMHTDKGWTQMTQLTQPKGMTSEEQSDETLFKFGQTVQGRRVPAEAVAGSGIMVNGNFGGGKKRAEAFAQNLQDVATLQESIPALIEMFKKPGHSISILNQKEHGIAMSHLAKIRAAIRVETVGTGPVALPEHEMINKRLGDPNATLTFDTTEIAKLQEILNTGKSNLQRQGVGLQITFRPPSKNGQNPIQQNRVANAANRGN